jgi:UDP-2,4-diacetamido-2,4,6-trideoxy-beta-L-altropyranose hydrolase
LIYELDSYLPDTDIVVLDGYKFGTDYQKYIKARVCSLVCIDDIHSYHFVSDIIINHGVLNASLYSIEPYTKLLLGPKYCLLRKPFLKNPLNKSKVNTNSVFLCFGGADAQNLTAKYLNELINHKDVHSIHVVVGSAFKYKQVLNEMILRQKSFPIHLYENVSAKELVQIINECKIAIVPGSTISLECASIGIGIICGYYVNNQVDIDTMMKETGMGISIGNYVKDIDGSFEKSLTGLMLNGCSEMIDNQERFFDRGSEKRLVNEFKLLRSKVLC